MLKNNKIPNNNYNNNNIYQYTLYIVFHEIYKIAINFK